MSISDRYRDLTDDSRILQEKIKGSAPELQEQVAMDLARASETLGSLAELVGEIPQFRLEKELTPVLIKAHSSLDRSRLQLEESGDEINAERVWEMEQRIYRLLNDL
jgi:hypothetical protein